MYRTRSHTMRRFAMRNPTPKSNSTCGRRERRSMTRWLRRPTRVRVRIRIRKTPDERRAQHETESEYDGSCLSCTHDRADLVETAASQISEEQCTLCIRRAPGRGIRLRIDVPVDDEDVLPAVVVVVEKVGAPPQERQRGLPEAALKCDVVENH